jgi:DNA-binding transcriptional LysR family regulator
LDIRRLQHFLAVAEEQNFTRASERLHIVQSGISASVRALERELGTPLFDRTTQRVELTAAGQALLPEARRILSDVEYARQVVAEVRGGLRGKLELGILYGYQRISIPALLARFRQGHPEVEIRLRVPGPHGTGDHLHDLVEGDLDLAFLGIAGAPPPEITTVTISTERVMLACAAGHRLAQRETVQLAELEGEEFIDFPVGWSTRTAMDQRYAGAGLRRKSTFEMNDLATILDMVRYGLGLAFIPEFSVPPTEAREAGEPGLRLLRIGPDEPTFDVVLATRTDRPVSPTARWFLATVREWDASTPQASTPQASTAQDRTARVSTPERPAAKGRGPQGS